YVTIETNMSSFNTTTVPPLPTPPPPLPTIPTWISCNDSENIASTSLSCDNNLENQMYRNFYDITQMVTGLVLYPSTCGLGLIGNILCLIVFSLKPMRTSTNVYLQALAVADTVKLTTDFLYFIVVLLLRIDKKQGVKLHGYLYPYAHYLFNMSLCISAWLTVGVSVERFIFICQPFRVKRFCNIRRAIKICTATFIFGTLISLPYMLRYRTKLEMVNGTVQVSGISVTALWNDQQFATIFTWTHALLRSAIPLLLLICLNLLIWRGLKRPTTIKKSARLKYKVTLTLIYVVSVFCICVTPDAILSTVLGLGYYEENYLARGVREITDYLLQVNSAVNFVIYYFSCTAFREHINSIVICSFIYNPVRQLSIMNEDS
ncbi:FMRFamide receptor-like, partial [Argonauta hians]